MTYDNPVFLEQKERLHQEVKETGFTVPKKLTDDDMKVDDFDENDDDSNNFKGDIILDEEPMKIPFKTKKPKEEIKPLEIDPAEEKAVDEFISNFDEETGEYKPKQELPEIKIPSVEPQIRSQQSASSESAKQFIETVQVSEVKTVKFKLPK